MTGGTTLTTAADLRAKRAAAAPAAAPVLPSQWTATLLLSPYGDRDPPMKNYSQLVAGTITYDASSGVPWMRISLYLTQDGTYMDFLFQNNSDGSHSWYWLVSTPGGEPTSWYGPFATTLQVPTPDFLSRWSARFGNNWPIMGFSCDGWVIPTVSGGQSAWGSWYSYRTDTGNLFRVFTFDSSNPVRLPILGAYYIANLPTFTPGGTDAAMNALVNRIRAGEKGLGATYTNDLVDQKAIQSAMAAPLASAPCTVEQIQAVIPGFVPVPDCVTLPVWTDKTFIREAWTIGTDFIPYFTQVTYWWNSSQPSASLQQSIFVGLGPVAGQGTYNDRQDCYLTGSWTDLPQYYLEGSSWVANCCYPRIDGVGVPVPDFVSAADGRVMAMIMENATFGLGPGQFMNLCAAPFQRDAEVEAIFWLWFGSDQTAGAYQWGVLFSEGNYAQSATAHNLQLIDYTSFERNASWIGPGDFYDPCPTVPACPTQAGRSRSTRPREVFGPATRPTRSRAAT